LRHPGGVGRIAFTLDGKRLASAGHGIKLWDVDTWQELLELPIEYHGDAIRLDFSPDGRRLVTGGPNHTIRVWDAEARPPCLFAQACHPRHRFYLRNQHWVRGITLAREYHQQVAWYDSGAQGDPQGAEAAYRKALEIQQGMVKANPEAPERR